MSLSDKIIKEIRETQGDKQVRRIYCEEDVKEFIKKLKEEFVLKKISKKRKYSISAEQIHKIINELAGKELANG